MVITNRDLPAGTRLVGRYKKADFVCEVGKDEEGKLTFTVDGKEFKSPSSAASHVMGGGAVNGWRFWSVAGEQPAEQPPSTGSGRAARREKAPKAKQKKAERRPRRKAFKLIEAMGEGGFWCNACMRRFASDEEDPKACPKGHRADDPELTSAPAPEAVEAEQALEA